MKRFFVASAMVVAGCLAVGTADAGNWGRPGLWSLSTAMDMKMPDMPQISPEQMAQMKKMGIKIPMMGEPVVSKICVTPQDAANFSMERASASERSGCKQTAFSHNGNHISTDVVCNGEMKGQGHSDVTLVSDSRYTTIFKFKGTSHGRAADMKITTDAHWLGGNCGDVKPFTPPTHHG